MVFRGNQRQSKPLSGTQRSPGPKTVTMTQDCQRHLWWRDGGARARAPSFAAPSSFAAPARRPFRR